MSQLTGLGRGLGSLIPKKAPTAMISDENKEFLADNSGVKIMQIPVSMIEVNPQQPRQVFNHQELEELIDSIKRYGIIQPLIVTKRGSGYELIAGERRFRSAKIIGLQTVPAIVREADEQEKLELALIENVQRKDLNPLEKAVAYQKLIHEFNLTQEEVAAKMGFSRSAIANTLRYLELPEEIQKALADGKITEGHAKVIAGLPGEKEQLEFLNNILQYNFSVRDAERESRKISKHPRPVRRSMKDPYIEEKEDLLRSNLNTKVNIKKQGEKGQIVIEFYSEEDLNSIINRIAK